ncbi:hypothetical protein [Mannheimia pernigra]|uniref:hypothetical protein n=1 Tax=Mannheimia pernigra TaxID=111844 RepID=UPI0013161730|nr:hypothetical protein [Mannheimia pernigra]QHB18150.1 hypothetical protein GM695_09000 [Mannheimia pernigra]
MKELSIEELKLVQGGILPAVLGATVTAAARGAVVGVASYGVKETFGDQNYNWKDVGAAAVGGATRGLIGNSSTTRAVSSIFFSGATEGLFHSISKDINKSTNKSVSDYDCGDGTDYQD